MEQLMPTSSMTAKQLPATLISPDEISTSDLATIPRKELLHLQWEGNYWKAQHKRACEREALLKEELAKKEALIKDLQHRLFERKSEKKSSQPTAEEPEAAVSRPRGQQPGSRGHGRIHRPNLPVIEEYRELHGDSCCCPVCGLPYRTFPGEEESDIFEIEVHAYRRKIHRKRYQKTCSCPSTLRSPAIIVAPPPPKLISRSPYGTSIWLHILLSKFLYSQPLNRILRELSGWGLSLSSGTITGGLHKIAALFEPLKKALYEHQMGESRFHNDESRWEVHVDIDGKTSHRWYMWVTRSPDVIYYVIVGTRSASVPIAHFSELEAEKAIVVCDRYGAYKKLARLNDSIILAFCWAHVRRDFLEVAQGFPDLKDWALDWVAAIGKLYHLNAQRLVYWQEALPLEKQGEKFQEAHESLKRGMEQMRQETSRLLQDDQAAVRSAHAMKPPSIKKRGRKAVSTSECLSAELKQAQRGVLTSLQNHWHGLIVFVAHPEIPMDNNPAERAIRNPVVGRKNYYGSGSIWSSELAADMFSLFQTIELWNINPRHWLQEYLAACTLLGGCAPKDISPFLPWLMSEERRNHLAKPPPAPIDAS